MNEEGEAAVHDRLPSGHEGQQLGVVLESREALELQGRHGAVRLVDAELVGYAVVGGGDQDPLAVVDEEGAGGIEGQVSY
ncbi:hypothetical protein D3C75_833340 [compost metagenome]